MLPGYRMVRSSFLLVYRSASLLLMIYLCAFQVGYARAEDGVVGSSVVESLNADIRKKPAGWTAGENPLSSLPSDERRKRLCGGRMHPATVLFRQCSTVLPDVALPASFDWRWYKAVSGVRDQGNCASCFAFASVAALESKILIQYESLDDDPDLSEQIVLSCSGLSTCSIAGYAASVADFLVSRGTSLESCYPYTFTNGACGNACSNWESNAFKLKGWGCLTVDLSKTADQLAENIKKLIYLYGPVVVTMELYSDFFYYHSGVYTHVGGDFDGGHVVLVVGWDDAERAFIVKNSWGPEWGEEGFFRIAYSEVRGHTEFGYSVIYFEDAEAPADYVKIGRWNNWFAVDENETPMVGDFNGDGKTDIITFTRDNPDAVGQAYVALSDGSRFEDGVKWSDWFAPDRSEVVVIGDFNGDRMDDAATWLRMSTGQVYVAVSYGAGMHESSLWLDDIGGDSDDELKTGDVNGDGMADLVLFSRRSGRVYVALSNGKGFEPPSIWHGFFAVSAYERPETGDVDGDGKVDIITFATNSPTAYGQVFAALSTGVRFSDGRNSDRWSDWFSVSPDQAVRVADMNGDAMADFVTFLPPPNKEVYVVYSDGHAMSDNRQVACNFPTGLAYQPLLGDVDGNGKGDFIIFHQSGGDVFVSLTP